jgi:hypothetical protein
MVDSFTEAWRREVHEADAARRSARISAGVARVRGRAPHYATLTAAAAIVAFAGVAAARLLGQRAQVWTSSAGAVVTQGNPTLATQALTVPPAAPAPLPSLASAATALEQGDAVGAMRMLVALRYADSSPERFVADSLLAAAAIRGAEQALSSSTAPPPADVLELIVTSTSAAISRAHPGSPVLAPLSLARAAACMGGHMNCSGEELREDLAWAILLGSPAEQDRARRLRATLVGDSAIVQ